MYTHPDQPLIKGRPFSGLVKYGHILQEYLNHPAIKINPETKNIQPQLVTGLSANHFEEHKQSIKSIWKIFPGQKVVVYDLGLDITQLRYFRNPLIELRKFNYTNFPEEFEWLTNMSFKVLILKDCLMEFGSCLWFDTSIEFTKNIDRILQKYIYERNSSFIYYIKPAMHSPAWATHPIMYSYFPSNITKMGKKTYAMGQGGATITVNTEELKQNVMKWAIACALTNECIAPNYPISEERLEYGTRYNPKGEFEIRHCRKKIPMGRPYTCHRFDQSMWAILVSHLYDFNPTKFRVSLNDIIGAPNRQISENKFIKPKWQLKG